MEQRYNFKTVTWNSKDFYELLLRRIQQTSQGFHYLWDPHQQNGQPKAPVRLVLYKSGNGTCISLLKERGSVKYERPVERGLSSRPYQESALVGDVLKALKKAEERGESIATPEKIAKTFVKFLKNPDGKPLSKQEKRIILDNLLI